MGVFVTSALSMPGVEVDMNGGVAFENPASSANLTFDGFACLILWSVSSSEFVIMSAG